MEEKKYFVTVDNHTVAERMSLEYALLFVKSIFERYCYEHFVVSIEEMPRCISANESEEWIKEN